MAAGVITWKGFLLRFLAGLVLVFTSYNPSGYSYYHWAAAGLSDISPLKAFAGVVLLIGWVIFLRATLRSLGLVGLVLALAFFGTLVWLVVDIHLLPLSGHAFAYVLLVVLSAVLATGLSWSLIRRRITGQVDVDEVDQD